MFLRHVFLIVYMKSITFMPIRAFAVPVHPDIVQEVPFGKNAVLHCPSEDQDHNFMFWKLTAPETTIIGPGNPYNREKYDYEILTGRLYIQKVSTDEDGILDCVSKGVRSDDISIRTVRMIVKKDWEEVYEEDPSINALRVFIAFGVFIILIGGSYLLYKNAKNKQEMQLFLGDDEDDESNDELFSQPGTSYRQSRSRTPSPSPFRQSFDSTSYKSVVSDVNLIPKQTREGNEKKEVDPFDPFEEDLPNFHL